MNFFDSIKCIYEKKKSLVPESIDRLLCITLNKWLTFDKDNLETVRKVIDYVFYIEPKHYFYLLYLSIPHKYKTPFLKKIDKNKPSEDKLIAKIQYVTKWSDKELRFNMPILKKNVLNEPKYWKSQLGVK